MKELAKILVYLGAVLVCGALLAPPLYWGAQALMDAGFLLVLKKYAFQKYFNRSVMVVAVLLLGGLVRWLGLEGWRPAVFRKEAKGVPLAVWRPRLGLGLLMGACVMGGLGAAYVWAGFYRWEGFPGGRVVLGLVASAAVVGVLEECVFRGVIAGLVERSKGAGAGLWVTSVLFAAVHFLKPDPSVQVGEVGWASGLALVPHMFHQFLNPGLLLGGFGTLLVLGLVLGLAVRWTGSLWVSIGFHAGLVLAKGVFSKGSERVLERLPWVGPELQVGLFPVAALVLSGVALWGLARMGAFGEETPS